MVCTPRLRIDRHAGVRSLVALASFLAAIVFTTAADAGAIRDNLYGVKAISPTEAWVVGNFGSIYHTTDAGKTWAAHDSGTKVPLFAVDFAPGAQEGWVVGKGSLILHTADGGKIWKRQQSVIPPEKHLFNVHAIDAKTVWVVGDWGAIAVTHDGGERWEDQSLGLGKITLKTEETGGRVTKTITSDVILYDVDFPDPQHGYIAGEFGTLLSTDDGGQTWTKRDVGTEKTLFGVGFATQEKGWVTGIDGMLLHTRDAGKTWVVQHGATEEGSLEELGFLETLKNPGMYDVAVAGDYGVVVGDTGNVLTTSDGGETWTPRDLPEKERLVWLRALSIVPGTHGFIVGANGFTAAVDHDKIVLPEH